MKIKRDEILKHLKVAGSVLNSLIPLLSNDDFLNSLGENEGPVARIILASAWSELDAAKKILG